MNSHDTSHRTRSDSPLSRTRANLIFRICRPNSEDISGSNSGGGDGNGGGGFIATDSTPEKKQRTSGIDPAIDPSRLAPLPPTPSPPALKNTGAGAAAAKNGKRKRDYELSSGDSASRNLAETDKVTFELFLTNPDVTPTSTQPASPPEEKPLISPGGGGAAAAKGGERKRDDDVRSGGSASRNLEATEKWTSEVLSTNPDSAPTTEESTVSGFCMRIIRVCLSTASSVCRNRCGFGG